MKIGTLVKDLLGLNKGVNNPSLFYHPKVRLEEKPTKLESENHIPKEFKWAYKRISLGEVYNFNSENININESNSDENNYKWINDLIAGKKSYAEYLEDLKSLGLTHDEATYNLNQSIYHTLRAKDWALENKNGSGAAADDVFLSIPFGILKILTHHFDKYLDGEGDMQKKILGLINSFFCGLRGYKQFKIYGERCDEDRVENKYAQDRYGNKACGVFSDVSYIFETKINPWLRPALNFTSEKIQKIIEPLLSLPNILWWRIRMPNEINQRFGTDLISYLFHKPLSLLGFKRSIKKIEEIKNEGNLNSAYIKERERKLIGLDPKKDKSVNLRSKLVEKIKQLFLGTINEKIKSSVHINKFISPFVGLYGFFIAGVGLPIRSALKFFDREYRAINSLSQSAFASQQIIYFFRLILPEYLENKKLVKTTENEKFQALCKKKRNLFFCAVSICTMNIIGVFLKLFKFENKTLNMLEEVYDEVADKGISYYLSKRRSLLGEAFELDNPELYEPQAET